ncbi:hypothetical protein NDU88_007534 [Pleurodeles waltl]|uniref:Tetraspanin-10 n=2 Tax=Pleurodeles waltl TaxID=8319 RepID=A0AAV7PTW9_PLEWA|nr:hypothetical protein NDU88_007534 [Pleurodeles waltl]
MKGASSEDSPLLPSEYRTSHFSGKDDEQGSTNELKFENIQVESAVEDTRYSTGYGASDPCLEKWHLLDLQSHQLDSCNPESCCAKYTLFFSNFGFSVLGLLILGVGIWGLIDKESLVWERIQHLGSDPMLFIVLLGLVMSVLSVTGSMGALRENACLLKFFIIAVVVFVVLQVLAGIVLYSLSGQISKSLGVSLQLAIARYQDDADMKFIMDEIQLGLECCGVESYRDWKLNLYFNCSSPGANACGVPFSCCIDPLQNGTVANTQCGFGALGTEEMVAQSFVYLGGCMSQLARWVSRNLGLLGTAAAVLLVLEILSLLLATRLLGDIDLIKSQW